MLGNPLQRVALHLHGLRWSPSPINFQSTSSYPPNTPCPLRPIISWDATNTFRLVVPHKLTSISRCPKACRRQFNQMHKLWWFTYQSKKPPLNSSCMLCHLDERPRLSVPKQAPGCKISRQDFVSPLMLLKIGHLWMLWCLLWSKPTCPAQKVHLLQQSSVSERVEHWFQNQLWSISRNK